MLERPPAQSPPAPPKPPTRPRSSTARYRRYRARKRAGTIVISVVVDFDMIDLLVASGFLCQWDAADRAAIQQALQQYLHVVSHYEAP